MVANRSTHRGTSGASSLLALTYILLLSCSGIPQGCMARPYSLTTSCYNHCSALFLLCDQQSRSMRETFNCIRVEWRCKDRCGRRLIDLLTSTNKGAEDKRDRKTRKGSYIYDVFQFQRPIFRRRTVIRF